MKGIIVFLSVMGLYTIAYFLNEYKILEHPAYYMMLGYLGAFITTAFTDGM